MPKCSRKGELVLFLFALPVQYLVPTFLTRAVLYAGKEAWKRRPFLLSSQICSNYRITSICGSLAAFWLPPPPFSSPLLSLSLSPLSFAFSPIALFSPCFYFFILFLAFLRALGAFSFFSSKNHSLNKVYDNQNILAFLANSCAFW